MHSPLPAVVHDARTQRFEMHVDGLHCEACYELAGTVMRMTHTGVPRQLEGRGIAAALVRAALEHARAQGLRVQPLCSYVRVYMRRHPETQDLLQG
jgi:predicted GNAT family acetyltransferase